MAPTCQPELLGFGFARCNRWQQEQGHRMFGNQDWEMQKDSSSLPFCPHTDVFVELASLVGTSRHKPTRALSTGVRSTSQVLVGDDSPPQRLGAFPLLRHGSTPGFPGRVGLAVSSPRAWKVPRCLNSEPNALALVCLRVAELSAKSKLALSVGFVYRDPHSAAIAVYASMAYGRIIPPAAGPGTGANGFV